MPIDPTNSLTYVLTPEALGALCERWQIRCEVHPVTGVLVVEAKSGPIDAQRLPVELEARADVQSLLSHFTTQAHHIALMLRNEDG